MTKCLLQICFITLLALGARNIKVLGRLLDISNGIIRGPVVLIWKCKMFWKMLQNYFRQEHVAYVTEGYEGYAEQKV